MARSVSTWKQQGKRLFAVLVLTGSVVHLAPWFYRRGRWSGNFGKGKFRLQTMFLGQPQSSASLDEYAREHARWQHEQDLRGLAELRSQSDTLASADSEHPTKALTKRHLHRIAATTGRRVSCVSLTGGFSVCLSLPCATPHVSLHTPRRKLCHILGEGRRRAHRERRI